MTNSIKNTELMAGCSGIPTTHATCGEQKPSLRVLLAEDSPTIQLIATHNLEQAGYVVEVADNGYKAVQALGEQDFDLVIMDVFMPEMNGLEATRTIRQQEQASGQRIPIVAMTGADTQEQRQKCLAAGMDGFVSKPVTPNELYEVIAPLLCRKWHCKSD